MLALITTTINSYINQKYQHQFLSGLLAFKLVVSLLDTPNVASWNDLPSQRWLLGTLEESQSKSYVT